MEIFEAANPIGAKRREVIETFEDEVQKASDLLVKKKQQEDLMAKYQKRVNTLQDALGSLDDPTGSESEDDDHAKLCKSIDTHQKRRDQCEKEVQYLTKTIARTYQFERPEGVHVAKVEIKPLKLPDNLSQDKGTKLPSLLPGWANTCKSKYWLANIFLNRMCRMAGLRLRSHHQAVVVP